MLEKCYRKEKPKHTDTASLYKLALNQTKRKKLQLFSFSNSSNLLLVALHLSLLCAYLLTISTASPVAHLVFAEGLAKER